jgi:preprotein translocase SecE subunit
MATAVETKPDSAPAVAPLGLLPASIVGAVVLLAGLVLIGTVVPMVWDTNVSPILKKQGGFVDAFFRVIALVAAVAGVVFVLAKLLPANPPKGLRGGIFLVIAVVLLFAMLVRWVGLMFEGGAAGPIITGVIAAALAFGAYKFLTGMMGRRWMVAIEEMGWFHTNSFKKTQGIRLRRWTMIGILLVGASGIWSLYHHNTLPYGDWTVRIPFLTNEAGVHKTLTILSDVRYTGLLLLAALTVWFAWRAVNVPTFADFLIATEAEMNKVSWTPWRKLVQDTIVVLVTTALLTAFLLVIDIFWGWLLADVVKVLPHKTPGQKADPQGQALDW